MDQRSETVLASLLNNVTSSEYISFLIRTAVDKKFSVAVWRLPNSHATHLIISREHFSISHDDNLEELPSGFIIAPFDKLALRIFLKADFSFSFENNVLSDPVTSLDRTSLEWLHTIFTKQQSKPRYYHTSDIEPSGDSVEFVNMVESAITEIEAGRLEKVVPSRSHHIDLSSDFDVVDTFQRLSDANPNAMISFVSTPESGTWIGATPELLVSVDEGKIFKTIALAGTQRYQDGQNLKAVAWTQKDIAEQALVERYIISCFKMIRLREYDEVGPKTVVAGNLLHLRSEFKVDMVSTNFPQLGSVMLRLLHPTSAVCGSPLQPALEFLKKHESYSRQFYSGYLGPVNFKSQTQIFVNLRCAQLFEHRALVYAGAGVTIDSDAQQEWIETEMKMNTLRNVLSRV